MRLLLRCLLILAVCQPGCGMFSISVPDWASKDTYAPGADGHAQSWIWRSKGEQWLKYFYESVVDGSRNDLGRAQQSLDILKQSAANLMGELTELKKEGARYVIAPDQNGQVAVRILRPGEGVAAGFGRAVLDKLNAGDERRAALLGVALGQLSTFASRIEKVGAQISYRQYGAVATLALIAAGKDSGFGLPDGATPKLLADVMRVLVVALQRDLDCLQALQTGALGISLATRAASFENPYSGANVAASVIAALADAQASESQRRAYVDYPPPAPVLAAALAEAGLRSAAVAKTKAYTDWLGGSHAQRELSAFGSAVATDLKAFSAVSSIFLGYDLWGATDLDYRPIDFADAATKLAERAPPASKVHAVFEKGAELTRARPSGALQLVESPIEADRLQRELGALAR